MDESFQGLLLRHRGRTGLTQRQLAERMGAHMRSVQEWETGGSYPSVERLQALIAALLESGGLQAGSETAEAEALWAAVLREAPRMQTPLDRAWLAALLTRRVGGTAHEVHPAQPATAAAELKTLAQSRFGIPG